MGMMITKPEQIELWQMLVLRSALKLEMLGLKISRGRTAYSEIKHIFNLKGNRQKVLDIFNEIIEQHKILYEDMEAIKQKGEA
jgi:hypothetical protein